MKIARPAQVRRCARRGCLARVLGGIAGAAALFACSPAFGDTQANVVSPATDTETAAPAYGQKHGDWVFVPVPVANPTFGNGLQFGALYLHPPTDSGPPATSGAGLMATDNGTRLGAVFHDQSFDDDRYRLTGLVGGGVLAAKFFGIGTDSPLASHPVDYSFHGEAFGLRGLFRVDRDANWFVGANVQQIAASIDFEASDVAAQLPNVNTSFRLAGIGPEVLYDSRDDTTYPTRGEDATLRWFNFRGSWGNQPSFNKGDADFRLYRSITSDIVGAVRARFEAASDNTPFFELPSMDLRGVSNDRYRDARVIMGSAEVRYAVLPRWGLLAFVDAGRAASTTSGLGSARTIVSYGGAVRWQASAERRLYLGVNVAYSTDTGSTVFIQVGERF
jgi:outer membrane protein assembly factor BamA